MLTPLAGFLEKEILGVFKIAAACASGLAVALNPADTSPLNPSPYGNSFGTAIPATVATGGRELGYLLQPVTTSGPSLLSVLSQVYDESIPAGQTAAIVMAKSGAFIGTDQYATGGATGALVFDNSVTLGTLCGLNAGLVRVAQAGDEKRLVFFGKVIQRRTPLAVLQIK